MGVAKWCCALVAVPLTSVLVGLACMGAGIDVLPSDLPSLEGQVAVITGSTSGIGYATAKRMHELGATVVVHGRSESRTAAKAESIGPRAIAVHGSLSDLADTRRMAADLLSKVDRIDYLIENAGMSYPLHEQPDSFESAQGHDLLYASNHIGHFLLTKLLAARLRESQATVVVTSSIAHFLGVRGWLTPATRPNLDLNTRPVDQLWDSFGMYGTSKLANLLFAAELTVREPSLTVVTMTPGFVSTSFGVQGDRDRANGDMLVPPAWTPEEAGDFTARIAVHATAVPPTSFLAPYPVLGVGTLTDHLPTMLVPALAPLAVFQEVIQRVTGRGEVFVNRHGHTNLARDPAMAKRLWAWSEEVVAAFA